MLATVVVNPRGHRTPTRFTPRGYPFSTTVYSAANQAVRSIYALGRTITYRYDPARNITKIVAPTLHETRSRTIRRRTACWR